MNIFKDRFSEIKNENGRGTAEKKGRQKEKTKEKQKSEKTGNEKHKEKFNTVKQTEEQE